MAGMDSSTGGQFGKPLWPIRKISRRILSKLRKSALTALGGPWERRGAHVSKVPAQESPLAADV